MNGTKADLLYLYKAFKQQLKFIKELYMAKTLKMLHSPIKDNDIWRTRYNNELHKL